MLAARYPGKRRHDLNTGVTVQQGRANDYERETSRWNYHQDDYRFNYWQSDQFIVVMILYESTTERRDWQL